jgi:hypothetical protein
MSTLFKLLQDGRITFSFFPFLCRVGVFGWRISRRTGRRHLRAETRIWRWRRERGLLSGSGFSGIRMSRSRMWSVWSGKDTRSAAPADFLWRPSRPTERDELRQRMVGVGMVGASAACIMADDAPGFPSTEQSPEPPSYSTSISYCQNPSSLSASPTLN